MKHNPIDPAIARLLKTPASTLTLTPSGGGGCSSASTYKLTHNISNSNSSPKQYFLKLTRGRNAQTMVRGEHASLSALAAADASLVPHPVGWGECEDEPGAWFVVMEFLVLQGGGAGSADGESLAQKLARLHMSTSTWEGEEEEEGREGGDSSSRGTSRTRPNPKPKAKPFGFPVPTTCGNTMQPNPRTSCWSDFFAQHRLHFILSQCEQAHGPDAKLAHTVRTAANAVVPRLLGDAHLNAGRGVQPALVHGDLWAGNAGTAAAAADRLDREGNERVREVVFDPAACYAHSEYELGIMRMFGGFGQRFMDEYHGICPKTEPVSEYDDRVALYEVYHHLNHYALFGGSYRSSAISMLQSLIDKYG